MPQVKRPVGRPPIDNPAVKRVAVKVTPEQHAAWMALGASRWLKEILDREVRNSAPQNGSEKKTSEGRTKAKIG